MNDAFDLAVSTFGVSATRSDNCLEPLGQERGTLPGHPTATSKRPPRIGRMHEQQSGEQADGRHWTAHNHAEMHGGGQVDAAFSDPVVLPATMRFYDRSRAALQRTSPGHLLTVDLTGRTTGSDWLLSLELRCGVAAAAESSPPHLFLASGRSTSELDVRRHRRGEPNPVTAVARGGSRRLSDHRG